MRPELSAAIRVHVEKYNLGDKLSEAMMCLETTSEKIKKGLFGSSGGSVVSGVIVTPRWLVWVAATDKGGPAVLSALLADIVAVDGDQTKFAQMVPDIGVEVTGSFTNMTERGSAFIGMDKSTVGVRFREVLFKAVQDAKK